MLYAISVAWHAPKALSTTFVLVVALHSLYSNGVRLFERFKFDDNDSTNFDDILGISEIKPNIKKHVQRAQGMWRGGAGRMYTDGNDNDDDGEVESGYHRADMYAGNGYGPDPQQRGV